MQKHLKLLIAISVVWLIFSVLLRVSFMWFKINITFVDFDLLVERYREANKRKSINEARKLLRARHQKSVFGVVRFCNSSVTFFCSLLQHIVFWSVEDAKFAIKFSRRCGSKRKFGIINGRHQ